MSWVFDEEEEEEGEGAGEMAPLPWAFPPHDPTVPARLGSRLRSHPARAVLESCHTWLGATPHPEMQARMALEVGVTAAACLSDVDTVEVALLALERMLYQGDQINFLSQAYLVCACPDLPTLVSNVVTLLHLFLTEARDVRLLLLTLRVLQGLAQGNVIACLHTLAPRLIKMIDVGEGVVSQVLVDVLADHLPSRPAVLHLKKKWSLA